MQSSHLTIYYDDNGDMGVMASCPDWDINNIYFSSWSEFTTFLLVEHGDNFSLVEITTENYDELRAAGVFENA